MGPDAMILVFWMLSFKPTCSLSSFTFIKRLFSCSSLSAIRVVSSVYLRWLIFLPAILIPPCASSSSAFRMMYSAYKLNKQGDNIQPWCTPFPVYKRDGVCQGHGSEAVLQGALKCCSKLTGMLQDIWKLEAQHLFRYHTNCKLKVVHRISIKLCSIPHRGIHLWNIAQSSVEQRMRMIMSSYWNKFLGPEWSHFWKKAGPPGVPGHGSLSVPQFLSVGDRLLLPRPPLSPKGKTPTAADQGGEELQRQEKSGQETVV